MYNALEDLPEKHPRRADKDGPNKTEPVHNVLEEPYHEGPERSEYYGAIPVNEPFYNTLEESGSNNGPQRANDEVVYNTLEEPYHSGAGEDDSYGTTVFQDPVYNVLEGPDSDDMDSSIPANIPVYAVVHKNKK